MRVAYFDCVFGVSGDMILGALVSCGVPLEALEEELAKLGIRGFKLIEKKVTRSGIAGIRIEVITEDQHHHRHLSHIKDIIESSGLSPKVKEQVVLIFTRLAEAEARVHGTVPEEVHFHEVGALDAIVDVVGACVGLDRLGVEAVVSTPLHLGTGTVKCAHGVMPVPVPAVVELTKGVPVVRTTFEGELTTPTGAAIVTTLVSSYGCLDGFVAECAGYGAGSRERSDMPNMLRITIGKVERPYEEDRSLLVETNIDNMNPEFFGYIVDRLFEAGAKDVYMTPVFMKKGRPGTLLSILTDDEHLSGVTDVVFTETTTLGLRIIPVMRKKLHREERTVMTEYGEIRVKVASVNGRERIAPEYEDCARIAREKNVPIMRIYDAAKRSITL